MEIRNARYSSRLAKKYRSKKLYLIVIAILLIPIFGYSYIAITKPLQSLQPNLYNLNSLSTVVDAELSWPSGQGVLGTVRRGILATSDTHEDVKPIASMTKLVTALAVLEKAPLQPGEQGQVFTITAEDVDIYYDYISRFGSIMAVRQGQQVSQYQALQGLLLPSANNMADLLAREIFGSEIEYVSYANNMIKRFGLENTVINDASGFSPRTVSSPSDMFEIGLKALKDPIIAEISAQREAFIPDSGIIRNTNLLLDDESIVGLKTGNTDEAGSCLLFAYQIVHEDGSTDMVVGVVMGVPSWPQLYREVKQFIYESKQKFVLVKGVPKGVVIGEYQTPWGGVSGITVVNELASYEWGGQAASPTVRIEDIQAPVQEGAVVGVISIGGISSDLVLNRRIDEPSIWWRLANLR